MFGFPYPGPLLHTDPKAKAVVRAVSIISGGLLAGAIWLGTLAVIAAYLSAS